MTRPTPCLAGPRRSRRRSAWTLAGVALFTAAALAASCGGDEDKTKTTPKKAPTPCTVDAECKDDNPCQKDLCGDDGLCTNEPEPDGEAPEQVEGDCRHTFCESGSAKNEIDDGDVPDDDEPCTLDGCTDGNATHQDQIDGAMCQVGTGAGACEDGKCVVPCTPLDAQTQCDDLDPCTNDGCVGAGFCEHTELSGPVPGYPQTTGDCMEHRCVEGEEMDVEDPQDVYDDGIECTLDECVAGTPVNDPAPAGDECSNSYVCDGRGNCVECVTASHCEDSSSTCYVTACNDNYCGQDPVPSGTPAPANMQANGDCKLLVCDGSGNLTVQPDDDPPPDDNNDCTTEGCSGSSPVYQNVAQGTPCGGSNVCNGQGVCCMPASCGNKNCGTVNNGCGDTINCGSCAPGDFCGLSIPNVCGCTDGVQNGNETGPDCGGACGAACSNGAPCSVPSDCNSGFCVDGVCCNSACGGACKACVQSKTGVANGTCGNVTTGTDPDGECAVQPASSCSTTGVCGAGACELHPAGTVCNAASCVGSTQTNADTCNGMGACVDGGSSQCGANYICVGNSCQSCSDGIKNGTETDVDCGGGGACADCANGKTCSAAGDCVSGFCVDGYCCNTACNGLCTACDLAVNGTCSNIPNNQDPDSECPGNQTCNGAGACN